MAASGNGTRLVLAPAVGNLLANGNGNIVASPSSLVELTHTGAGRFFVSDVQGVVEMP